MQWVHHFQLESDTSADSAYSYPSTFANAPQQVQKHSCACTFITVIPLLHKQQGHQRLAAEQLIGQVIMA